jgi:hypothetical protein
VKRYKMENIIRTKNKIFYAYQILTEIVFNAKRAQEFLKQFNHKILIANLSLLHDDFFLNDKFNLLIIVLLKRNIQYQNKHIIIVAHFDYIVQLEVKLP